MRLGDVTDGSLRVNLYENDLLGNQPSSRSRWRPGGDCANLRLSKDRRTLCSTPGIGRLETYFLWPLPLPAQAQSEFNWFHHVCDHRKRNMFLVLELQHQRGKRSDNKYTLDPQQETRLILHHMIIPAEPWFTQPPSRRDHRSNHHLLHRTHREPYVYYVWEKDEQ